ncbi:MAG: FAD-dependent monooxygenase [Hyphomicrobiales bacterium]|nr:FAD-dependent monooxygenase [Hyphomicrobiales bacterium]
MATKNFDAPVLIAGGGLVGLSMAMFLAEYGVRSLAIERLRNVLPLPRAAFFHMRTIELFRSCGIEAEVRAQSEKEFTPEGAVVAVDYLAGKQIAAFISSLNEGVDALSPCRRLFVTQPGLEPILRRRAEKAGAKVVDGLEVVGVEQDSDSVTVIAKDVDSGNERRLTGQYLLGADGAHSRVRDAMNIPFEGRGVFSNSITIYFHADLAKFVDGRGYSVIYVNNPALTGFFRLDKDSQTGFFVVNTVGDTSKPEAGNAAADVSDARLAELVRIGIGVPDYPLKIDGVARWRSVSDVARHYQAGRVFIAGDAAHVMPPNGGFGGNTGVHDAHNLAWKIALVLKGLAGPDLLATYEQERRPPGKFTVEQAYTRYVTRSATYLGAKDFEPPANDFNIELGYLYRSPAVVSEDDNAAIHADPRETFGRPGSRAPHVWIEKAGKRISTLDLFGKGFVLLAAPDGGAWAAAAGDAGKGAGVGLEAYTFGSNLRDPDNRFAEAYGLTAKGAVLVRPDGFVAWRAKSGEANPREVLQKVLGRILCKS